MDAFNLPVLGEIRKFGYSSDFWESRAKPRGGRPAAKPAAGKTPQSWRLNELRRWFRMSARLWFFGLREGLSDLISQFPRRPCEFSVWVQSQIFVELL